MSSITFGDAELVRNGTVVTCFISGRALARVNLAVMEATDEVPLTLFLADRKFDFSLAQTKAFLDGMPKPEPVVVESVEKTEEPVPSAEVTQEEEVAPKKRGRRS